MREERIVIGVAEDGSLTIETRGFKGKKCEEEVIRVLQDIASVTDTQHTAEYLERPPTGQVQREASIERSQS